MSRPRCARRVRGRRALTLAFAPRLIIRLSGGCQISSSTNRAPLPIQLFPDRNTHPASFPFFGFSRKYPVRSNSSGSDFFRPAVSRFSISRLRCSVHRLCVECPQRCDQRLFAWLVKKFASAFRIATTLRDSLPAPSFKPNSMSGSFVAYFLSV